MKLVSTTKDECMVCHFGNTHSVRKAGKFRPTCPDSTQLNVSTFQTTATRITGTSVRNHRPQSPVRADERPEFVSFSRGPRRWSSWFSVRTRARRRRQGGDVTRHSLVFQNVLPDVENTRVLSLQ